MEPRYEKRSCSACQFRGHFDNMDIYKCENGWYIAVLPSGGEYGVRWSEIGTNDKEQFWGPIARFLGHKNRNEID
jgi:hypothetical protein